MITLAHGSFEQRKAMLTDQDIEEFQQICREELGKEISKDEAMEYGARLVDLYRAIYKPIPEIQNP